jgi:hypothetical protein
VTALLSLLLPGIGHAYVGKWGEAVARAVMGLWVLCMALIALVGQGPGAPMSIMFTAVAGALWAVGSHDAYREAAGDPGAALLRGRSLLGVFLGLMGLSIVAVMVSTLSALRP